MPNFDEFHPLNVGPEHTLSLFYMKLHSSPGDEVAQETSNVFFF